MHRCFAACISEYLIPTGARRGCQISWNQSKGLLLAIMLVLRTKPRSFGKTVHTDSFNSITTMIHLALSYLHLYLIFCKDDPHSVTSSVSWAFQRLFAKGNHQPHVYILLLNFSLMLSVFLAVGLFVIFIFYILFIHFSLQSSFFVLLSYIRAINSLRKCQRTCWLTIY